MVFLVMEWSAENIEEKKKLARRKTLKSEEKKNEEHEESQITTIYIFGFKSYFAWKHNLKKKVTYTIKFYLQFSCVARYLKHSNGTPNLNICKHTNYNITEICINRLSTTTQIFIAMDYLIMMPEKYLYF